MPLRYHDIQHLVKVLKFARISDVVLICLQVRKHLIYLVLSGLQICSISRPKDFSAIEISKMQRMI